MDEAKLRAWWFHRQGLDGSLAGASAANVLKRAGWARSVAGSGPYLTFFSRAGISRESVDVAVANLEIHELPSARGCTYVLPVDDFALGLRVGQQFSGADMNVSRKLGVTDHEVAKLCSAVIKALDKGPLSPEEIREATGKAARNLGPEGAKKGLTTSLPLALGTLQASGQIRRIPNQWAPRSTALSLLGVEAKSSGPVPPFYFRFLHRTGSPLFPMDRTGNIAEVPMVFRAWR